MVKARVSNSESVESLMKFGEFRDVGDTERQKISTKKIGGLNTK